MKSLLFYNGWELLIHIAEQYIPTSFLLKKIKIKKFHSILQFQRFLLFYRPNWVSALPRIQWGTQQPDTDDFTAFTSIFTFLNLRVVIYKNGVLKKTKLFGSNGNSNSTVIHITILLSSSTTTPVFQLHDLKLSLPLPFSSPLPFQIKDDQEQILTFYKHPTQLWAKMQWGNEQRLYQPSSGGLVAFVSQPSLYL